MDCLQTYLPICQNLTSSPINQAEPKGNFLEDCIRETLLPPDALLYNPCCRGRVEYVGKTWSFNLDQRTQKKKSSSRNIKSRYTSSLADQKSRNASSLADQKSRNASSLADQKKKAELHPSPIRKVGMLHPSPIKKMYNSSLADHTDLLRVPAGYALCFLLERPKYISTASNDDTLRSSNLVITHTGWSTKCP